MSDGEVASPMNDRIRKVERFGYGAGLLTLLFLMAIAIVPSVTDKDIRCSARFPVVAVLALGAALAGGAIGGSASAKGKLPIPGFAKGDPIAIAVGGGVAVLLIVLLIGYLMYVRPCSVQEVIHPEILVKVPDNGTVAQTLAIFEKTSNVNVDTTGCSAGALARGVQSGEIRAASPKAWLLLFSSRVRGPELQVKEVTADLRYAIICQ